MQWAEGTGDASRRDREVRYGLTAGVRQGAEGRTWRYVLTNRESGNLHALDEDRMVGTFQVLPGVFTAQNALAAFYWLTLWLPVVALGVLGARWWSGRVARPEAAVIAATALLCLIISHTLVRNNPSARLADVAAPTLVLAAWLARRRGNPTSPLFVGRLRRAGMVSLFLLTFWSVWTSSGTANRLARAGVLDGPTGIWEQLGSVNRQLHRRPIDEWAPPGSTGLRALTRYVFDCTTPSDRVLVTWFAPDVFFYAERGFAGGQVSLFRDVSKSGWHSSPAEQRLTVERMQGQSVPIILGRRDQQDEFSRDYPLIYDHVQTRYTLAAESTFGENQSDFLVFVDRRLEPYVDHPDLGLPCYREAMADINGFDDGPFIHVRWVENVGDAQRSALERSLGLYRATHTEGTTWRYRVPDVSPDRFDTINAHDMVADTYGFDRAADARFGPVIHVRWVETLGDARRTILERALGLYRGEHTEGTTWRYRVPDGSPDRLRAIVAHDMVADTSGFDRGSLELDAPEGDVARLAAQPLVYSGGWHPPESDAAAPDSTWRWTQQTGVLSFANPNADSAFYLDYAARPNIFADGPQSVTVSIGDQVLQSFAADSTGRRLHPVPLPTAVLGTGDRVEIQIAVDPTFVPANVPSGGRDDRELGIQVYHAFLVLTLTPTLHEGPTVVQRTGNVDERQRVILQGPAGADHRRPRFHRQQPGGAPRRAGRRRPARRLVDPRLRGQPVQHRADSGHGASERLRRARRQLDAVSGARPGDHLQSRRTGQSHRQHARPLHRSRDQLPQPALDPRGVPTSQPGRQGRLSPAPARFTASRTYSRSPKSTWCVQST